MHSACPIGIMGKLLKKYVARYIFYVAVSARAVV